MSVNLFVSTEEASVIVACLDYVRHNIVVDENSIRYRFVSGKPFSLSIRDGVCLDFLRDYIAHRYEDAVNSHPLNPFINVF